MKFKRLQVKLIFVQILTIIPFLLFIFYLFDLWFDTHRSLILRENLTTAKLVASFINQSFKTGDNMSLILSTNPTFLNMLATDKGAAREEILSIVDKIPELNSINVFDGNGKVVITSLDITQQQEEEVNISNRDYFQQVKRTKKKVVSSPIIGKFTGKQVVTITAPIIKNGEVEGVVVSAYLLDYIKDTIEQTHLKNDDKIIALFDSEGKIVFIAKQPYPTEKEKSLFDNMPIVKRVKEEKSVLIENQKTSFWDDLAIGAAVSIDDFDWVVISIEPMKNVFAPLFKVQNVIWLIIFSALLFSFGIVSYFIRKVKIIY